MRLKKSFAGLKSMNEKPICYLVLGRASSWRCYIVSWMARWESKYREHFAVSSGRTGFDGARDHRRIRSARAVATTFRNPAVVGIREGPDGGNHVGRRPPVFSRIAPFAGPLTRWRVHKVYPLNPTKCRVLPCVSFLSSHGVRLWSNSD